MTTDLSEFDLDPLHDSEAQERAKLAALRTARAEEDDIGYAADQLGKQGTQGKKINTSYQHYLFGTAGSTAKPAWSDSMKGRIAIRIVSRGVVGALFFASGSRIVGRQMEGYSPTHVDTTKPLQLLAKGFDATLGAAIKQTVKLGARITHSPAEAARIAEQAVNFRQSLNGGLGRSYGAEVVGVTFDFAMASLGDATTRNVIEEFDPNTKKTWLVNDKGEAAGPDEKRHIDLRKMAKGFLSSSWRILSKNQGEDWAAGIVYVFQMKLQRQWLNSIFKGHDIAFDNNWNGGAYKLNSAGKVVGDYQLPGAIDLHVRFVGYNWYTLMFREGYDAIANKWTQWKEHGFALNQLQPESLNPLTNAAWLARYATKSFIKANLYMQPAVIPFWVMRAPQSKWRGSQINPETHTQVPGAVANPYDKGLYANYSTNTKLEKLEKGFSRALHPLGEVAYNTGSFASRTGDKMFQGNGAISRFLGAPGSEDRHTFMRNYTNAAFSYTPYMIAKAETALVVDERPPTGEMGSMDKAIYRLMHQAAHFQLKDVWQTTKDIATLSTHYEHEADAPVNPEKVLLAAHAVRAEPKAPTIPRTMVQPEGRTRHDPVSLDKANDNFLRANDNDAAPEQHRATGTHDARAYTDKINHTADRNWAKSVRPSLSDPDLSVPPTRH